MSSRISTEQLFTSSKNAIAKAREREMDSSEKASTQKQLTKPSDNPGGWVQAANIKDDISQRDGIARNANMGSHMLAMTENVLSQVQDNLQRAHELAITASSTASLTQETRQLLLTEVKALYDSTLQTLNTKYAGRTLLGGFKTQSPAFDADGKYIGDNQPFIVEIGKGLMAPTNISAEEIIKGQGTLTNVDIPETLHRLAVGLDTDDTDMIRSTLDDLMKGGQQLDVGRSVIGARMSEIQRQTSAHDVDKEDKVETVSQIEDADAMKTFSDLSRDQVVLKAAIATGDKLMNQDPSGILFNK